MAGRPLFIYRSTCSTCRKAREALRARGVACAERDTTKQPLSEAELRELVGEQEITPFLNPRNELYRARQMKTQPPERDEAFALLAENPTLLRRPLLVTQEEILFGFDAPAYERLVERPA